MPIGHLFFLIEFLIFSLFYLLHFRKNNVIRLLIGINMLAGAIIAFADAFYINGIWNLPTLSRPYFCISIVLYTLIYFYFLFKEDTLYSQIDPMFWVSAGVLIYFASNLDYFMSISGWILNDVSLSRVSWYAHGSLNIVANLLYALAFWCFKKQNPA